MNRKLVLAIAAAAVIVAVVAGSIILRGSEKGSFAKQATPILSPVEESASELADALDGTKGGNDLTDVGRTAGELDVASGEALDKARDLDSSDRRQGLLIDFLEATQAYARDIRAAGTKLTYNTVSKAEESGRAGESSREELASADSGLPLPEDDTFDGVEHLSTVAKSCGGVPPDAVALVGDQAVSRERLAEVVSQATTNYRLNGGTLPLPVDQYQLLRRSAVVLLVDRIQFAESAKELGITITREQVKRRLEQIKQQFFGGDDAAFRQRIASQKLTEADVERDIRAQLTQKAVLSKVSEGYKEKQARKRAWTIAMKKRFAKKTIYRAGGYGPPGTKGAPTC